MAGIRSTLAFCAWLLAGCKDGSGPLITPAPPQVLGAPEQVVVGGVTVRLETYLWRDFQPVSPADGKPLSAVLRVRSTSGEAIPRTLRADSVWVLTGGTAWVAEVVQEYSPPDTSYFEVVAREGPKWGPGIEVDVVLRLRNATGDPVLLRASAQLIHRTD